MTGSLDSYFRNLSNIAGTWHSIDVFTQFILVFLEKPLNHIEFSELRRLSMQKPPGVHPIVAEAFPGVRYEIKKGRDLYS